MYRKHSLNEGKKPLICCWTSCLRRKIVRIYFWGKNIVKYSKGMNCLDNRPMFKNENQSFTLFRENTLLSLNLKLSSMFQQISLKNNKNPEIKLWNVAFVHWSIIVESNISIQSINRRKEFWHQSMLIIRSGES